MSMDAEAVRTQLARMLASEIFRRSERLSAFLRYVVEQTLAGQAACLKEQALGCSLYGRGPEFDGAADPIVRVDARRLRDKLREYYALFPDDPVVIALPKGSYVPVFADNGKASGPAGGLPQAATSSSSTGRRWRSLAMGVAAAGLLAAIIAWSVVHRDAEGSGRLVRITSFPGEIGAPALSPDGNFVALSWRGPDENGELDIWVKRIGSDSLRRLTETPKMRETAPAWSPDGSRIAFVRARAGVFVVPASGGAESKVADSGTHVGWAGDGKSLLVRDHEPDAPYCIYQIFVDSRERRRLTHAPVGIGDWRFNVSPDGSTLAFIRYGRPGIGDLYVVSMQGGEARRLTNWNGPLRGVDWSPDGRDLIYSVDGLWRISAGGTEPGRGLPLQGVPVSARNPSISRPAAGQPTRLAFQIENGDTNFRIVDLEGRRQGNVFQDVKPFAATRLDYPGQFSPDGRNIAFVSARGEAKPGLPSTTPELWVAGSDGSGLRQLVAAPHLSLGDWSPDGRSIVYDAAVGAGSELYVIDGAGGQPKRLTHESAINADASFSRDGSWIYFSSTSTGSGGLPEIWKMPSMGGKAVRITHHGGLRPRESADGRFVYYADRPIPGDGAAGKSRLMQVGTGGGAETALFSGITPLWWSVTNTGILFVARESEYDAMDRYNFRDRTITRIGRLPFRVAPMGTQMNTTRDGRLAIVSRQQLEQDLMFLDHFR